MIQTPIMLAPLAPSVMLLSIQISQYYEGGSVYRNWRFGENEVVRRYVKGRAILYYVTSLVQQTSETKAYDRLPAIGLEDVTVYTKPTPNLVKL